MIGTQIGHYKILESLGKGGMGEVYLAQDLNLNRRVALKLLPPEFYAEEERRLRFQREARAVASLNHPNIVTIYSVEEADGLHYFTMELIEGEALGERIPEDGLSPQQFYTLAIPLVSAVLAAHEKGVTHRDLKPANVMVSGNGTVKVLDFGLAKLRQENLSDADATATSLDSPDVTRIGRVLGTASYMAPEQAEGKVADARSDIFSLGIVLYQMATGQKPFQGDTQISVMSSILKDEPTSLTELRPQFAPGLSSAIEWCLVKDPEERSGADDLLSALRDLKRQMDTGELLASGLGRQDRPSSGSRGRMIAIGLALLALVLAGGYGVRSLLRPSPPRGFIVDSESLGDKTSIAVFSFQNLSGDPELDWLRAGLADMLVTDLAQVPTLKILSMERLRQILEGRGIDPAGPVPLGAVQDVARQARAGTAVLGSFLKAGTEWRVDLRLQDPADGEIIESRTFQKEGESAVLSLVDDLTNSIQNSLELASLQEGQTEKELAAVTTDSVDAYRYYLDGLRAHSSGRHREAIPSLMKAVELDPDFAMAWAKLSVVFSNIGNREQSMEYGAAALRLVDRLSQRERHYIEGHYYSLDESTWERSARAYQRAIELFPDHHSARNNLALMYLEAQRYQEAIQHFERLREEGTWFPGTYANLARAYSSLNRDEEGLRVLREYVAAFPENAPGYSNLADALVVMGRLEEAVETVERGHALAPGSASRTLAQAYILLDEWEKASNTSRQIQDQETPLQWTGHALEALIHLYFGRVTPARVAIERGRALALAGGLAGSLRTIEARLAFTLGNDRLVLRLADAPAEGFQKVQEQRTLLGLAALSALQLGQDREARRYVAAHGSLAPHGPDEQGERFGAVFEGRKAMLEKRFPDAVEHLLEANSLLPGVADETAEYVTVWYGLGLAHWAMGSKQEASTWFLRVTEAGLERLLSPVDYVRSHYYLGLYFAETGDLQRSRTYYRTVLDFWEQGELEPELVKRVSEAL